MLREFLWRSLVTAIVVLGLVACFPQPQQPKLTPAQVEESLKQSDIIQYDPEYPANHAKFKLEDMAG